MLCERADRFAGRIRAEYEPNAKSCETCETKGICCLDAHFVNVHITRLEAAAIKQVLAEMESSVRTRVEKRIADSIVRYGLDAEGDTTMRTFACPLYESGAGCLVHNKCKPAPCIVHACYENKADLPPEEMLATQMDAVEKLNERTYGERAVWLPLPSAIR